MYQKGSVEITAFKSERQEVSRVNQDALMAGVDQQVAVLTMALALQALSLLCRNQKRCDWHRSSGVSVPWPSHSSLCMFQVHSKMASLSTDTRQQWFYAALQRL